MEHERAQKKINETANKTENLEKLKQKNDQEYMLKLAERERQEREKVDQISFLNQRLHK